MTLCSKCLYILSEMYRLISIIFLSIFSIRNKIIFMKAIFTKMKYCYQNRFCKQYLLLQILRSKSLLGFKDTSTQMLSYCAKYQYLAKIKGVYFLIQTSCLKVKNECAWLYRGKTFFMWVKYYRIYYEYEQD